MSRHRAYDSAYKAVRNGASVYRVEPRAEEEMPRRTRDLVCFAAGAFFVVVIWIALGAVLS